MSRSMGDSGKGNAASGSFARRPGAEDMEDDMIDYLIDKEADGEDDAVLQSFEDLADDDVDAAEGGRNWDRPDVAPFKPTEESIVFQQMEVDYYLAPYRDDLCPPGIVEQLGGRKPERAPVIRMYGTNAQGNSVCALVHGFLPYFYIRCPPSVSEEDAASIREQLNKDLAKSKNCGPVVVSVEAVRKCSIWFYQRQPQQLYMKITLLLPNLVAPSRAMLEHGMWVGSVGRVVAFETYESNVLFVLRFMVDTEVQGCNWVELPAGKYHLPAPHQCLTHCQIEADIHYQSLISHAAEGLMSKLAPFRILAIDIECAGRKGHFPEAEHDPVIQIASVLTVQGEATPRLRNVMTLKSCASIVGAQVMSFDTEQELLLRWRDLLAITDPDIVVGYNICNFDLPYLINRAKAIGVSNKFDFWGRIRRSKLRMKEAQFSSKAYGTHSYKDIVVEGRTQFDLLLAIQRDHKLSSYSLNSVSAHFLGDQKEDVHHSCITDLQNGNDETRRRLAVYCLKDAELPQRLLDKLMYMYNYVEMARVTGTPLSFLLTRGQSVKVFSQILRKARSKGYVVPFKKTGAQGDGVAYEGATVLEPRMGFYREPIATLDFASLYPSIMMAHNLCYSTLLQKSQVAEMSPEDIGRSPCGDWFVKEKVRKGILPEILQELLSARKRAKADLKAASDPFVKAVLNGRQLALKVSANSVYGFTGATVGKLPCLEISGSVTAYGRQMIQDTQQHVERLFCRAKGYESDCTVIYGDTDSVMVNFKVGSIKRAMELGEQAAELITKSFPPPVKLEFEKVYQPYLLMNKKRYAGLLWTQPDKWDTMDAKGIETVRRDNCQLVRNMVETCLDRLLRQEDVEGATEYVKSTISDLLMNRVDMSLLVVSKALAGDVDSYKTISAHVELARKMQARDPATAPSVGDRVPYVIIKGTKGAKAYEKAEDPIYALDHNLPIDAQHYLDHHLTQPLMRIFEPIMGEKKARGLLVGEHTRSISISTPASMSGIMKHVKKGLKCMNCKAALPSGRTTLCEHCDGMAADVYQRTVAGVNVLEQQFAALWTQCQRCQGSLHQDVLCTNGDCPIFYRRKKVQRDLDDAHKNLARFPDW